MFRTLTASLALILVLLTYPSSYGAQTAGELIDDSTLATRVKAALAESDDVSALDINVEVHQGIVQLSGFVDSDIAETAALATAGKAEGARDVIDAIVVLPGSRTVGQTIDDATIQTKLKAALADAEGLSNAIAINTGVRQGHVLLAGFLPSEDAVNRAVEVARAIDGVKEVHNYLTVP